MSHLSIAAGHAHAWIYDRSGGRIGARIGGHPVLLLTTTGRRSGRPRRTPVQYERVDGEIVLVAAAGGAPRDPAWFRNAAAEPHVHVRIGRREGPAVAHVADEGERSRLWPHLCARNPALTRVARRAHRVIPVVILRADDGAPFRP